MERRRRSIGIAQVFFHHIGTLDLNFALNTTGAFMTIPIRDPRLIADRLARRADFMQAGIQGVDQTLAGSAITITTAALAVGTFILVFSNTYYYQNVALMLTPIIVVALLLDLLFLPPLLVKLDRLLDGRLPAKTVVEGEPASTPISSS